MCRTNRPVHRPIWGTGRRLTSPDSRQMALRGCSGVEGCWQVGGRACWNPFQHAAAARVPRCVRSKPPGFIDPGGDFSRWDTRFRRWDHQEAPTVRYPSLQSKDLHTETSPLRPAHGRNNLDLSSISMGLMSHGNAKKDSGRSGHGHGRCRRRSEAVSAPSRNHNTAEK